MITRSIEQVLWLDLSYYKHAHKLGCFNVF